MDQHDSRSEVNIKPAHENKIYTVDDCFHEKTKVLCTKAAIDWIWREAVDGLNCKRRPIGECLSMHTENLL